MKIYDFEGQENISENRIHQSRTTQYISQADLVARTRVRGVTTGRGAMNKIETGDRFATGYELMVFS